MSFAFCSRTVTKMNRTEVCIEPWVLESLHPYYLICKYILSHDHIFSGYVERVYLGYTDISNQLIGSACGGNAQDRAENTKQVFHEAEKLEVQPKQDNTALCV